jgi:predicted nicotinamide N-methyase
MYGFRRGVAPADAVRILAELVDEGGVEKAPEPDRLVRASVPIAPEVRLHLAADAVVLWARLEAAAPGPVAEPFWASAWAGGQGLARHLLNHPRIAKNRRVLDIGSGSGLVAIAAAMTGGEVTANDIDPFAVAAIGLNAELNGVKITVHPGDLLSGTGDGWDLVLAGDALYNPAIARAMLPFLYRVVAKGGEVLIGDPGRGHLPRYGLTELATYGHAGIGVLADHNVTEVTVFRLSG